MAHPKRATDSLTEKQWMRQVVDLAKTLGWSTYHPYLSIYSAKGWPDLALWRERLILAELKTSNGRLSPSQVEVITGLKTAGVEVYVWRPEHLDEVVAVLRERRG